MIDASCPTALGALCGQLTFRLRGAALSSYGDRTFTAAGPRVWNSLPVQLRNPDITYGLFRRQMKGYLFRQAQIIASSYVAGSLIVRYTSGRPRSHGIKGQWSGMVSTCSL